MPIPVQADHFAADANDAGPACFAVSLDVIIMPLCFGRRHQVSNVTPNQILDGVTEDPLCSRVGRFDNAFFIDCDDRFGDIVDYRAQASECFLDLLLGFMNIASALTLKYCQLLDLGEGEPVASRQAEVYPVSPSWTV